MRAQIALFAVVLSIGGCASEKEHQESIEREHTKLKLKAYKQANFTCEFEMKIKPNTPEFTRCGEQAYSIAYDKVFEEYKREVLLGSEMASARYNASRPRTCSPNGFGGVTCY
jgi:hypothetical protein